MEVKVHETIWLAEKWIERWSGWELVQIVIANEDIANATANFECDWTVTKYTKEAS